MHVVVVVVVVAVVTNVVAVAVVTHSPPRLHPETDFHGRHVLTTAHSSSSGSRPSLSSIGPL